MPTGRVNLDSEDPSVGKEDGEMAEQRKRESGVHPEAESHSCHAVGHAPIFPLMRDGPVTWWRDSLLPLKKVSNRLVANGPRPGT